MKKKWNILILIIFIILILFLNPLISAGTLKVTNEHPFLINNNWIPAKYLKTGDLIKTLDGKLAKITSIQDIQLKNPVKVFNLEASVYHDFIVSEDDLIVHNSNSVDIFENTWELFKKTPKKPNLEILKKTWHEGDFNRNFKKNSLGEYDNIIREGDVNPETMLFRGTSKRMLTGNGDMDPSLLHTDWGTKGEIPLSLDPKFASAYGTNNIPVNEQVLTAIKFKDLFRLQRLGKIKEIRFYEGGFKRDIVEGLKGYDLANNLAEYSQLPPLYRGATQGLFEIRVTMAQGETLPSNIIRFNKPLTSCERINLIKLQEKNCIVPHETTLTKPLE